jgi:pimeloyl-ACP methyl ester carboxylesterase
MKITSTRRGLGLGAAALLTAGLTGEAAAAAEPKAAGFPRFTDHFVDSAGVKIHYVTAGKPDAPLVVMVHGYPDFWYTWRHLMTDLAPNYRVVAMDQRGYNLSDKPEGVANYDRKFLIDDIAAVIHAEGRKSCILIGHDWGASTSWAVALQRPELVDRLVIMSVPHPANMARELRDNPVQQAGSQYARNFQKAGSENSMTAEGTAGWVKDPEAKPKYVEAFKRSSFASMMNYYRANYPSAIGKDVVIPAYPKIKAPVLVLHGEKDTALQASGHDGTWKLVEKDTTVVMFPEAGHWIEQDVGPQANRTIKDWLAARPIKASEQR